MSAPETARDVIGRAIHEHDANAYMSGVEWPTWDELDDENRAAYRPVGDAVLDALTEQGFAVVRLPEPTRIEVVEINCDPQDDVWGSRLEVRFEGIPRPGYLFDRPVLAAALLAAANAEAGDRDA